MLTDSMPVITCSGKRKAKGAKEITDKGFCSSKGMYYPKMSITHFPSCPEEALPAKNGPQRTEARPSRDGMSVENGTQQNNPARPGRNVNEKGGTADTCRGCVHPLSCPTQNQPVPITFRPWPGRVVFPVFPFLPTFRPGRDGLTGGYSVCCRQAVFSSGHDRRNV
ncbi:MAG: hypothetical protein LBJ01_04055 [Tannerella sp.]|jgi:hypothetical protein|nr:hypothetical protein [Tannerella sp.]